MLPAPVPPSNCWSALEQQVRQGPNSRSCRRSWQEKPDAPERCLGTPGVVADRSMFKPADRSLVISAKRESRLLATDSGDAQQATESTSKQATPLHTSSTTAS